MLEGLFLVVLMLAGGVAGALAWQRIRARRLGEDRLAPAAEPSEDPGPPTLAARPLLRRYRVLPWAAGAVVAAGAYLLVPHPPLALALGALVGLLGGQLDAHLAARRTFLVEAQ